ncbi:hypothetical protein ACH5RR_025660 [Cinchona calisaya]|uniref:Uncharacterized protein n=1 Tax=Cinchona calisaya TaxID=153742 RepID=A0ABD2Z5B1_9GENT
MVSDDLNETSNMKVGCQGGGYDCENWLVEKSGVKILGKCGIGEVGICGVKKWGSSEASEEGPPPAGAPTSKLQFHLLNSSTRLIGMPPLHSQLHQLKIGQPKVVHEIGSENENKSGNRLEVETDEEVEEKTEEEVEGETEEDVEHESEDVIPIPYKKRSKKKTSSLLMLEFVRSELPVPIVNWKMIGP